MHAVPQSGQRKPVTVTCSGRCPTLVREQLQCAPRTVRVPRRGARVRRMQMTAAVCEHCSPAAKRRRPWIALPRSAAATCFAWRLRRRCTRTIVVGDPPWTPRGAPAPKFGRVPIARAAEATAIAPRNVRAPCLLPVDFAEKEECVRKN